MRPHVLPLLVLLALPLCADASHWSAASPVSTSMPAGLTEDVVLCDVNGNGVLDLLLLRAVEGFGQDVKVVALRNDGTGAFAEPVVTSTGVVNDDPHRAVCGRVDADAFPDLIVANGAGDAKVLRGAGNGMFSFRQTLVSAYPSVLGLFDADSFPDLFVSGGVMRGVGDGAFVTPAAPTGLSGILVDITGDGRLDSVNPYSQLVSYVNDGAGNVVLVQNEPGYSEAAVIADFTGDGFADVLFQTYEGIAFRRGHGDGTFDVEVRSTVSPSPFENWYAHKAEAHDVDGDGLLDFTYGFQAHLSDGAGLFKSRVIRIRDAGAVITRWGDVTGDGRADLVLVDRSSGAVQVIASTTPTATRVPAIELTRSESLVGYAQEVTYRAKVSGAVPLSGAVRFRVNGVTAGLLDVNAAGEAALNLRLPTGPVTMIATYTGDPEYSEASATMSFDVHKAPTIVTIAPDRNPQVVFRTVRISPVLYVTYAVSGFGFPGPTGTLAVTRDGISLGAPDAFGRIVTTFPEAGEHTVRAEYAGDDNYLGSFAEYVQIVEKDDPPVAVVVADDIVQGMPVPVRVHIGGGSQNQTGTVVFWIDGAVVATRSLIDHLVQVELTFPTAGLRSLKVAYSGDANWLAHETTQTVNVASPTWLVRPLLAASARSGQATLQWSAVPQASAYVVWRKTYFYDPWQMVATVAAPGTSMTLPQTVSRTNAYAVSATRADGATSLPSVADIATALGFAPVTRGSPIDDLHIRNLLDAFASVYSFAGRYMERPSLDSVTSGSPVRAADLQYLRDSAQYVRGKMALPVPAFTDPVLTPGSSFVRAVHLHELQNALD